MKDRDISWGIIGTGMIAKTLMRAISAAEGASLLALASRDAQRAERFAGEYGIPHAYGTYEALLADPAVDVVYVSLPNALHAEWSIRAMAAGKHVLCEKPLARTVDECRRMIAAAQTHRVRLMEAFQFRFHPQTHRLRSLVADGAIGELRLIRSAFSFVLTDADNVRFSRSLAGGALMDVGCYCVNLSRHLAGAEPLFAYAEAEIGTESGVDETTAATLRFPGEVIAQFDCSFRATGRSFVEVVGSAGKIEVTAPWRPPEQNRLTVTRAGQVEMVDVDGKNPYVLEVEHLSTCVRDNTPVGLPLEDSAANTRVLEALLRALREGRRVEV